MRGDLEEPLALGQRLVDQPEFVVFEVAQATMDELCRRRRRRFRKITHLAEKHLEAASGRVAGNPGAIDPSADDKEVVESVVHRPVWAFLMT